MNVPCAALPSAAANVGITVAMEDTGLCLMATNATNALLRMKCKIRATQMSDEKPPTLGDLLDRIKRLEADVASLKAQNWNKPVNAFGGGTATPVRYGQ